MNQPTPRFVIGKDARLYYIVGSGISSATDGQAKDGRGRAKNHKTLGVAKASSASMQPAGMFAPAGVNDGLSGGKGRRASAADSSAISCGTLGSSVRTTRDQAQNCLCGVQIPASVLSNPHSPRIGDSVCVDAQKPGQVMTDPGAIYGGSNRNVSTDTVAESTAIPRLFFGSSCGRLGFTTRPAARQITSPGAAGRQPFPHHPVRAAATNHLPRSGRVSLRPPRPAGVPMPESRQQS